MKSKELYPGWKMTISQHGLYFRLLADACDALHAVSSKDKERVRQEAHMAAFGRAKSAKDINTKKDFDAIATEFKRIANVVDKDDPQRRRALYVAHERLAELRSLTSDTWCATLLKDRFKIIAGVRSIEDLNPKDLADLIRTCNDRIKMFKPKIEVEVGTNGDPVW